MFWAISRSRSMPTTCASLSNLAHLTAHDLTCLLMRARAQIADGLSSALSGAVQSGRLLPQALVALAALFMAFEAQGGWCEILNLVLIVLLPKSAGGFRPIGLFPALIRVCMRRMTIA